MSLTVTALQLKQAVDSKGYRHLVLDDVLGADWRTRLTEAGLCVRTHNHGEWAKVADAVRNHRPSLLARIRESVVDWLNG